MKLRFPFAFAVAALVLLPTPAAAQCLLCGTGGGSPVPPIASNLLLRVEIETQMDFSRVATGAMGGQVELDPVTGQRRLTGDLMDLGGFALTGEVRVTGIPGAQLRVVLPTSIDLEGDNGSSARVTNLVTNLTAAPRLGLDGTLRFRFGGRLQVRGAEDGDYRGRIPITVEYQ